MMGLATSDNAQRKYSQKPVSGRGMWPKVSSAARASHGHTPQLYLLLHRCDWNSLRSSLFGALHLASSFDNSTALPFCVLQQVYIVHVVWEKLDGCYPRGQQHNVSPSVVGPDDGLPVRPLPPRLVRVLLLQVVDGARAELVLLTLRQCLNVGCGHTGRNEIIFHPFRAPLAQGLIAFAGVPFVGVGHYFQLRRRIVFQVLLEGVRGLHWMLRPASVYCPKKRTAAIASKVTGTHIPPS